jgi:hypothetical protein
MAIFIMPATEDAHNLLGMTDTRNIFPLSNLQGGHVTGLDESHDLKTAANWLDLYFVGFHRHVSAPGDKGRRIFICDMTDLFETIAGGILSPHTD